MKRLFWRFTVMAVELLVFTALVVGPFILRMLTSDRF